VSPAKIFLLIVVFFVTNLVSVVTGSTSLVTVPAMIQLGIEPHVAVATNMLALIFMTIGGSLPFAQKGVITRHRLPGLIAVTIVGSTFGAALMVKVSLHALKLVIAIAMITVAIFSLRKQKAPTVSPSRVGAGYLATFGLAVYGGFFSGGYVTLLTAAFVFFFGMTFLKAIATTKIMNIFASVVAVVVFAWHDTIDYKLGVILGIAMFVGGIVGASATTRINPIWLRPIFVAVVFLLAVKLLANFAAA
jgi:uncharacterized protein